MPIPQAFGANTSPLLMRYDHFISVNLELSHFEGALNLARRLITGRSQILSGQERLTMEIPCGKV